MEHYFQIFLHIVLFGTWFGSLVTLLVLLLSGYKRSGAGPDGELHLDTLGYVQRVPKASLILMLPMGLQLSGNLGLITLGDGSMVGVWAFAVIWLAIDWIGAPSGLSTPSRAMRVVERVLQAVFVLMLLGAGILSHLSGAPVEASWLATKLIVFAAALVLMSGVDALLEPIYRAARSNQTDTDEPRKRALLMAAGLVVVLLALMLFAAWTGFTNWRS